MRVAPEVVEGCRSGDPEAFETLVRETHRPLYSLVYRLVGNHDDAADVLQEVYVRVWRNVGRFRGEADIATWLHRVATNAALTHLRRRSRLPTPTDDETLAREPVADVTEARLDAEVVQRALQQLPAHQRAAVVLKDVYGWSIEEIAKAAGMTEGATKLRIFRARRRLADLLTSSDVVVPLKRKA